MFARARVRGLFFDVDGTLSDTDDVLVARLARILRPLRWLFPRHTPERLARRVVMALETPFNTLYAWPDRLGLDDELVRVLAWLGRRLPHRPPEWRLVPGVRPMLAALARRYPLAVVSARPEGSTLAFLDTFDLRGFFCCVATAQTCEHTKPYPDPVLWAAERMGIAPEEGVMIGDTTVDIVAGRRAGSKTIGVLCGFGEEEELRRAGANAILPTTAQVAALLEEGDAG